MKKVTKDEDKIVKVECSDKDVEKELIDFFDSLQESGQLDRIMREILIEKWNNEV